MTRLSLLPNDEHADRNRRVDMRVESARQTNRAIQNLYADPNAAIRFPYDSVHQIVHRVSPGRLVFVMANTGQGKTTFLLDCFDRWAQAGHRIDYLGTEQEPDELRTKWSCLRVDFPAGIAINREWSDHPEGESWKERVEEDLGKLDDAYGDQVLFLPDKFLNLQKIEKAAQSAYERRSQILIVDHIDRVETGASDSEYLALKGIVRRLKELARDCDLVMVVASQVNRQGRAGDRLANYRAPQVHHMQGGGMKEQEADVVLGLWRPIRQPRPGETPDAYKRMMAKAKAGEGEPRDWVEPNTMAVVCLKHRTWGSHEGLRCKLSVTHGRIEDIPERDRYTTRPGERGQV